MTKVIGFKIQPNLISVFSSFNIKLLDFSFSFSQVNPNLFKLSLFEYLLYGEKQKDLLRSGHVKTNLVSSNFGKVN